MPDYLHMEPAARQKSPSRGGAAARADVRVAVRDGAAAGHGLAGALNQSPQPQSLLQMRRALDHSPGVQAQLALQRALNRRGAGSAQPGSADVSSQALDRVKPTLQMKGVAINDDARLEQEADAMGGRAGRSYRPGSTDALQFNANIPTRGDASGIQQKLQPRRSYPDVAQRAPIGPLVKEKGKQYSLKVPDLPGDIVAEIQKGVADPTKRQDAVDKLWMHLKPSAFHDAETQESKEAKPVVHAAIRDSITVKYEAGIGDYGEFSPTPHGLGGELKIGPLAFTSAPLLYSTFRHELIHAEQFRLHQQHDGQNAPAKDASHEYFYTPHPVAKGSKGYDKDRENYLAAAAEIETHAWEILSAQNTGTDNPSVLAPNAASSSAAPKPFIDNRLDELAVQWTNFKLHAGKSRSRAYYPRIEKAINQVEAIHGSLEDRREESKTSTSAKNASTAGRSLAVSNNPIINTSNQPKKQKIDASKTAPVKKSLLSAKNASAAGRSLAVSNNPIINTNNQRKKQKIEKQ